MSKAMDDEAVKAMITALKTRDALTGLYNREHFIKLLNSVLSKPASSGARVLLYLRPDNYGRIDERFGPSASDSLLQQLAVLLKQHLSSRSLLARFGGNAFLALLIRENAREVEALSKQIVASISDRLYEVGAQSTGMTASIGVVALSPQPQQADEAIAFAQAAARQARESGGNCVHFEEPTDTACREEAELARWATRIAAALENDDFHLVYQPIVKLDGSNNFNYDVLLRMLDSDGKHILPGEFMPAAERAGLMPSIDRWVIRRAFGVAAARHVAGKKTRIFVRISEATLRDETFFGWLGLEALNHRLDEDSVVLQLAENVAARCVPIVRRLATSCTDLHLKLSLANPGPEGRCTKLVREDLFHFLVLDGKFIQSAEPGMLDALLFSAVEKGTSVIASHVESAADMARLYSLGVEYVSGYHVQEPGEEIADDILVPGSA